MIEVAGAFVALSFAIILGSIAAIVAGFAVWLLVQMFKGDF